MSWNSFYRARNLARQRQRAQRARGARTGAEVRTESAPTASSTTTDPAAPSFADRIRAVLAA